MSSVADTLTALLKSLERSVASALRSLLENKHLYQSIRVNNEPFPEDSHQSSYDKVYGNAILEFGNRLKFPWRFNGELPNCEFADKSIKLGLPTIKVYCANCERIEPFNPVDGYNITLQARNTIESIYQVFVLQFQCQSCRGAPEVFMVKRQGWKLSLTGRCPMEEVKIPNYFPKIKAEGKYYSDALVAYNSGQVLAGLFLLRTFIEQHANKNLGNTGGLKADQIIDAYIAKLPDDFKDRNPSLKKIYEKLSGAIHTANASAELFQECSYEIDLYFDAKRLYNKISKTDI